MIGPSLRKGVALSPGIGRGAAWVVGRPAAAPGESREPHDAEREIERFRAARARSESSLLRLREELSGPLAVAAEGILGAQQLMLRDPTFITLVERRIREQSLSAEGASLAVAEELAAAIGAVADPYLRERSGDVRDIGQRILAELGGRELEREIPFDSIVVVRELEPSFVASLRPERVRGVVTELGARASHASILLRSAGIPAVGAIPEALGTIEPGCPLLVDGIAGLVFVAPSPAIELEYDRLESELRGHDALLEGETGLPVVTRDGAAVHLAANIGKTADAEAALRWGAQSVGLFRTEFAFGIRDGFPSEDDQTSILSGVAERLHPRPITFRLLDLGADKTLPYFPLPMTANPALGLRGTRLLLAHQDVLRTQLRAILRVSADRQASVLLPMVGGVEEVRAVRAAIAEESSRLRAAGTRVPERLAVGAMIEIPSAVLVADELARETEFLSLGSNDLAQYLLAADRDDPAMSPYYRMLHPALLRAIRAVVRAAGRASKELTLCGEAAGDPDLTELFLGLGLRRFSVAPRQLGELRHQIRRCDAGRARSIARRLLGCATRDEAREVLDRRRARSLRDVDRPRNVG
ncbi:MAG TPA: phosphoenolpyruvate--protein phosphotransferase [Thermoanaerobaculia bacterium]|nr:phosphoenolpyruvate--protein phosphotransferase [Thermoanaerobaculia bacterium]